MESFAELFEASIEEQGLDIERGSVITGTVVAIDSDWITVDTGLKSEGIVAREEFLSEEGELEVEVGDSVDVVVEAVDNGMGQTLLSREKAKRVETWNFLEKIADNDEIVRYYLKQSERRFHCRYRFSTCVLTRFFGRCSSYP